MSVNYVQLTRSSLKREIFVFLSLVCIFICVQAQFDQWMKAKYNFIELIAVCVVSVEFLQ